MNNYKTWLLLIFTILLSGNSIQAVEVVPPTHPAIRYTGRVDRINPQVVMFDWPGVTINCNFTGEQIGIRIEGGAENYFNLFIDGELISVFSAPSDTMLYFQPSTPGESHELLLTKRTEAEMGIVKFYGLIPDTNGAIFSSNRQSERRIEFIGNSITCGYGNEGSNRDEPFRPDTENNYKSYAAILARIFFAEAHFIAHSGRGVVRNYGDKKAESDFHETMPGRYNRTLDNIPTNEWDFNLWKADCVVINLGTNDFSTTPHPGKETFLNAYRKLIMQIRTSHGDVPLFCVVGPMLYEPCFSYVKELTSYFREQMNDKNIYFAGLPDNLLNQDDDLGSDWHPSYQGQLKIAFQLLMPISTVMKWNFNTEIFSTVFPLIQ